MPPTAAARGFLVGVRHINVPPPLTPRKPHRHRYVHRQLKFNEQ